MANSTRARLSEDYGKLPLQFEANQGQTDKQVKFVTRREGLSLFLTPTEAVLALQKGSGHQPKPSHAGPAVGEAHSGTSQAAVVRMRMIGGNPAPQIEGVDRLPGKNHYFIGNDPKQWHTSIPTFARVKYSQIYPGVDMIFYGTGRQLEYDFLISPGADPKQISLSFRGEQRLRVDGAGDLVIETDGGSLRLHKPNVYQQERGQRHEVAGRYVVRGRGKVGIEVGKYDSGRALVIDPVLAYSTYLGGSSADDGLAIAVDSSGNAYVTGWTVSFDFPTRNPLQPTRRGRFESAFISKLSADGTSLVYSTYLGGSNWDHGHGIAVDASGNAYLTGSTASFDFPTVNPLQPAFGGGVDAFIAKVSADGASLIYSSYLGGSRGDFGGGIAVDTSGSAYITGYTFSFDFPTVNPLQAVYGGGLSDGFIAKVSADGASLVYSTYLGGSGQDLGRGIAVDSSGTAYVAGTTDSTNFPTVNPLQPMPGGYWDAFVSKVSADGASLVYSTYLGGSDEDFGAGIAVDSSGSAYVVGTTRSPNFPTVNPLQPTGSFFDAFVSKVSADGASLVYSTYLGGTRDDIGYGIAVDSSGNAYVTGTTESFDFPLVNPVQPVYGGGISDAFVSKVSADGALLVYSTYLGGADDESGRDFTFEAANTAIAVDTSGAAYITGYTKSSNFPTTDGAFAPTCGTDGLCNQFFVCDVIDESSGECIASHFEPLSDAFVTKIAEPTP